MTKLLAKLKKMSNASSSELRAFWKTLTYSEKLELERAHTDIQLCELLNSGERKCLKVN